jgi:hypothetical protein
MGSSNYSSSAPLSSAAAAAAAAAAIQLNFNSLHHHHPHAFSHHQQHPHSHHHHHFSPMGPLFMGNINRLNTVAASHSNFFNNNSNSSGNEINCKLNEELDSQDEDENAARSMTAVTAADEAETADDFAPSSKRAVEEDGLLKNDSSLTENGSSRRPSNSTRFSDKSDSN